MAGQMVLPIMCCLLIFISKAKAGQIHKLGCSGKRGSEEEDFILQREIAGDGSVADGASGTENQICPVTDVLLDHIGVSVFDCDTKAIFADMIRVQVHNAKLKFSGKMLKKRRLIAYKSDLRVIVISADIAYCIGCT